VTLVFTTVLSQSCRQISQKWANRW